MSIGKHTSLHEARKKNKLDRFMKEHPSTGNGKQFDETLNNMIKKKPTASKTSKKV